MTDIITPYFTPVLDALAHWVDLTALFCSHTGTRGMNWSLDLPFRHEVIGGLTIRRRAASVTDYYLSPRIVTALSRARPEAIISSGFSVPSLYAALYARARRLPLIIQSDGTGYSEAQLSVEQRLSRSLLRKLAWGAAASSSAAARRFVDIGFETKRVFSAPHAVEVQPLWNIAENRPRAADQTLRVVSVGRLIAIKGCDLLLRAVAKARNQGVDVRLTMIGSGPERDALRLLAADLELAVDWVGFVAPGDMPRMYAEADVLAFPTLCDTFGIVLIEAAAAGLPLIASPFAGATEDLVRDGVNGFVVDPRDTLAMTAAITRMFDDPELRARMGRSSYELTRRRTPTASAAGYLAAIETALGGRAAPA